MLNNELFFVKQLQKSSSAKGFTPRLPLSYYKLQLNTVLAHTFIIKHSIIVSSTKLTMEYGLSRHFAWDFHFRAWSITNASKFEKLASSKYFFWLHSYHQRL